jgi:hypothetical protein
MKRFIRNPAVQPEAGKLFDGIGMGIGIGSETV